MSKYGIQNGLLSDAISIGRLNRDKTLFLEKEDHTEAAISAVVGHVFGKYRGNLSGETRDYLFEINVEIKEAK